MSSSEYESVSNHPLQDVSRSRYRCAGCCLVCGVCRILCYTVCCKACRSDSVSREELTLLCLGLEGAGKSTLLAQLAGEKVGEDPPPTLGFSIKAVLTERAVLNVKELGGGVVIRQYWDRYFDGHDAWMFVIDGSSCDEMVDESVACLSRCLINPALQDSPLLVICSKQDKCTNSSNMSKMEHKVKRMMMGHRLWKFVGSGRNSIGDVMEKLEDMANTIIDR